MVDYDLIVKFKEITNTKTAIETAKLLDVRQPYISQVKQGEVKLSLKVAHKMYLIAGNEIAIMWGKLQEEKVKRG